MKLFYISTLLITYIIQTYFYLKRIINNRVLTRSQKIMNSIFVCLLPFVWYFLIKDLIKDEFEVMTKTKRDYLQKKERGLHNQGDIGA